MFRSTLSTALVSLALIATAGSACAGEFVSNGRTREVRHGDLDLARASDQQQLRQRIARAASRVCSSMDLSVAQACTRLAIAHAQAPVAAAIARAETGDRYADAGMKVVRPVTDN